MLTRIGSPLSLIVKSSAGSSGSRRRHGEENGSPTRPLAVASAAVTTDLALDCARRDLLTLAECGGVLRRARDHAREELGAPVADVLELRDTDVLHTRQARTLRGARVVDRGSLHRGERLRRERRRRLLILRDPVRREPRTGGDGG